MHLSPDQIERRSFGIEDRGYDRDEVRDFLLEVASALRLSLHTTRPPATAPTAAVAAPVAASAPMAGDDFARLGAEVAEILRSAHDAVASLHEQADAEIAVRKEEGGARADEVRRQAEADAAWTHDRAKRVLITAQEQADAIVAEAESSAADLLTTARRQAKDHADQVATRTRRHAEQILRAEREALRRLHQAQAGVAAAVEMLTGSESRPVVDLTELRPAVRLGSISVEIDDEPENVATSSANDPVARMIASAVERAAEHALDDSIARAETRSARESTPPSTPTNGDDPTSTGPRGPAPGHEWASVSASGTTDGTGRAARAATDPGATDTGRPDDASAPEHPRSAGRPAAVAAPIPVPTAGPEPRYADRVNGRAPAPADTEPTPPADAARVVFASVVDRRRPTSNGTDTSAAIDSPTD